MNQLNSLFICTQIVVIGWLLVGCIPVPVQEEGVRPTTTSLVATQHTATATAIPPLATPTPGRSATSAFTATFTSIAPTLTSTPTPTATPVPTLTYTEEAELLQDLMATNQGCQLPCWWGLNLGDTLTSIAETFRQWGVGPWRVTTTGPKYGYINLGYYNQETGFNQPSVDLEFYTIGDVVHYIRVVGGHESRLYGEAEFIGDWEKYFLPTILQMYGKPSLVYLRSGGSSSTYELRLYYLDAGMSISYAFWGTQVGNSLDRVCFMIEDVWMIQLYLYNPEFAGYWPVPRLRGLGDEANVWLIENMLGMDLDTFYETYQDPDNLGCVEVSR